MTARSQPRMARPPADQVLKNRDGAVPTEPLTLNVNFEHGSRVQELGSLSQAETLDALRSLNF